MNDKWIKTREHEKAKLLEKLSTGSIWKEREALHETDRVKLESWMRVMDLVQHYSELVFDPIYKNGNKFFAPAHSKEIYENKTKLINAIHNGLIDAWDEKLGKNWRLDL
jgi:hypothetical protein